MSEDRPSPPAPSPAAYHPALDGLRAVSVIAVIAYHAEMVWFPGGFLGVEVFFAISGFLITGLLAREWSTKGRIALKDFWIRRARRLLPALVGLLVGVVALAAAVPLVGTDHMRADVLAAIGYCTNIVQIVSRRSYFEQANPGALRHLWSLAIEEQFYLVWPLLVIGGLAISRPPELADADDGASVDARVDARVARDRRTTERRLGILCLLGSAASFLWMALLSAWHSEPSRVYYGTDTRAGALLLGGAVALLVPTIRSRRWAIALDAASVGAVAVLVVLSHLVTDSSTFIYRGGFLLVDAATLVTTVAVTRAHTTVSERVLGNPVLVWIGKRSYGLYLWHWPIFLATRPGIDIDATGPWTLMLRIALVVAATEVSYRIVEAPFRKGGRRPDPKELTRTAPVAAIGAVCIAVLSGSTPWSSSAGANDTPTTTAVGTTVPTTAPPTTLEPTTTTTLPVISTFRVVALGDSVMAGSKPLFKTSFGDQLVFDAIKARQWSAGLDALRSDAPTLGPTDVVVLHLGQNGAASRETLDAYVQHLRTARRVVLLTVHVHRRWQGQVNEQIRDLALALPNASLLDWDAHAEGHREWFVRDGIHLTGAGIREYVAFVKTGLGDVAVFPPPTTTTTTTTTTSTTSTSTTSTSTTSTTTTSTPGITSTTGTTMVPPSGVPASVG